MSDENRTARSPRESFTNLLNDINANRLSRREVLRRGVALGLSIPAIGALLAACGGDEEEPAGEGATTGGAATEPAGQAAGGAATEATGAATGAADSGTLTIIQTGSIPDLDPHSAYDSDASAIFFGTYEMLLRFRGESTTEFEPMLATSWESNEDMTEWTFEIPDGVTFHDGNPCTADEVVQSFQRFHNLGLGPVNVLTRFVEKPEDITAPDKNHVTFKLKYGTDVFLGAMASQYGPLVVSPYAVEEHATDDDPYAHEWFRENIVGTGPYVITENVLGDHITMERFENYHRGWEGQHFNKIIFRNVEETSTRRQLVESGQADTLTQTLTPSDVVALEEAGKLNVLRYPTTNADWVLFNYVRLADPTVRRGLAYAFPYDDVRIGLYEGLYAPSSGPVTPTTAGYPQEGFIFETDLDLAQQLLEEGGFDFSQPLEFWVTAGDELDQGMAQLYQANLQQIGVTVDIVQKEEGAFTDFMYGSAPAEERPHFASWGWWPDYNDAWNEIYPNFHTESITPNGSNALYYSNATVDELLDKSATMSFGPEYDDVIAQINQVLVEEDPAAAFIGSVEWYTVLQPNIRGFEPNPIYINTWNVYDMYRES